MMGRTLVMAGLVCLAAACTERTSASAQEASPEASTVAADAGLSTAYFAGGCFWCMEGPFEAVEGVAAVVSGYTGGPEVSPTYQQVSSGRTGHTEAVRVVYDESVVTYAELLEVFWRSMDPTDAGGQFADRGSQYRPAIFVNNDEERVIAEASKAALQAIGPFERPIIVPIEDAGPFWDAEEYHQDYYRTNPDHYQRYRRGSGREAFLAQYWGASH